MLRLWRNLQLCAMSWSDTSVILTHPHKLRCSKWLQWSVRVATASSVRLTHRRRYTIRRLQQQENTLLIPVKWIKCIFLKLHYHLIFLDCGHFLCSKQKLLYFNNGNLVVRWDWAPAIVSIFNVKAIWNLSFGSKDAMLYVTSTRSSLTHLII